MKNYDKVQPINKSSNLKGTLQYIRLRSETNENVQLRRYYTVEDILARFGGVFSSVQAGYVGVVSALLFLFTFSIA